MYFPAVIVPEGIRAGQTILVAAPGGAFVSAVVPDGCFPGHNFLVRAPPPVVVTGVPMDESTFPVAHTLLDEPTDLHLSEEKEKSPADNEEESRTAACASSEIEMSRPPSQPTAADGRNSKTQSTPQERFLIQVPPGVAPGSKIRVKLSDGRTVDVAVPRGEVSQFYVQVPRNPTGQNWHDSPAAYAAPMVIAPLLL